MKMPLIARLALAAMFLVIGLFAGLIIYISIVGVQHADILDHLKWFPNFSFGNLIIYYAPAIFIYLLPAYVAMSRRAAALAPIAWLNILFGWTVLIWFACLLWSIFAAKENTIQN